MNNRKASTISITLLFMCISQLLYLSLLSTNRIQSERYQGMIDYYQSQIQLTMSESMIVIDQTYHQVNDEISSLINLHSKYFQNRNRQMILNNDWNQIKVFQSLDKSEIMILEHQVFFDRVDEWENAPWHFSGTIDDKKIPHSFVDNNVQDTVNELDQYYQKDGFKLIQIFETSKQGSGYLEWKGFEKINYNQGMVLRESKDSQIILKSKINNRPYVIKKKINNSPYKYLLKTKCYLYKKAI